MVKERWVGSESDELCPCSSVTMQEIRRKEWCGRGDQVSDKL